MSRFLDFVADWMTCSKKDVFEMACCDKKLMRLLFWLLVGWRA